MTKSTAALQATQRRWKKEVPEKRVPLLPYVKDIGNFFLIWALILKNFFAVDYAYGTGTFVEP